MASIRTLLFARPGVLLFLFSEERQVPSIDMQQAVDERALGIVGEQPGQFQPHLVGAERRGQRGQQPIRPPGLWRLVRNARESAARADPQTWSLHPLTSIL